MISYIGKTSAFFRIRFEATSARRVAAFTSSSSSLTSSSFSSSSSVKKKVAFNPFPFAFQQEVTITIDNVTNTGMGIGRVLLDEVASSDDGDKEASNASQSLVPPNQQKQKQQENQPWVVMVPLVIEGEVVRARVHTNRANFSEADLVEVIKPSPSRVQPKCKYFEVCGGCQYQHMDITTQRQLKRNQVKTVLARIGGIEFPGDSYDKNIGSTKNYIDGNFSSSGVDSSVNNDKKKLLKDFDVDKKKINFIRENTSLICAPLVPEVKLHLATEAFPIWRKTEEELEAEGVPPPFWAFAWAGGQALSRYILDNPTLVSGKTVLDFGSGSGIVGIAAALAGATRVVAADIDVFAIASIVMNAEANGVSNIIEVESEDVIGSSEPFDVILVGDMLYEKPLADRLMPWLLESTGLRGSDVLLGDPGRSYFPRDSRVEKVATYNVQTTRELEDAEIRKTSVHRLVLMVENGNSESPLSPPVSTLSSISSRLLPRNKRVVIHKSPVDVSDVVGIDDKSYGYRAKLTPHYEMHASELKLGFFRRGSRTHVDIDECLIASDRVNNGFKDLKCNIKLTLDSKLGKSNLGDKAQSSALNQMNPGKEDKEKEVAVLKEGFALDEDNSKQKNNSFPRQKLHKTLLVREHDSGVSVAAHETVYQTIKDRFDNEVKFSYKSGDFFQNNLFVLPMLVDHVLDLACRPYSSSSSSDNGSSSSISNSGNSNSNRNSSGGISSSKSHTSNSSNSNSNSNSSNICTSLIDMYCGSGLFTLFASKRTQFSRIVGVEVERNAVKACTRNAILNGIDTKQVVFKCAKAEDLALGDILGTTKNGFISDTTVAILDPPRSGCDEKFLKRLLEYRPRRIIYISCEPSTQARDARVILDQSYGYEVESIVPFDMFPHTRHIENVVSFVRL